MDHRREKKEKNTLLEMDSLHSANDLATVHKNNKEPETNRLTDDRSPEEVDGNEHANAMEVDACEEDSCSSSSEEDEESHILDPNSCKGKIAAMMKSNVMQYCVIAMVIADCLIIVLELLIDMEFIVFPESHADSGHNASHHPVAHISTTSTAHHLGHDTFHHNNHTSHNSSHLDSPSHGSHSPHHHSNKEKAEHILHALSLTILSLFMIEVSLKIYVEGKHLLRQKAEVFDAVVVIVSFTLDIVFSFVSIESAAKDAAGLMVILRLWRVTRIINGVILSVKIEAKKKTTALKKVIRQLEHDNRKQRSRIDKLEKENSFLRQQLTENNDGSTGRITTLLLNKVSHGGLHHHHHHHEQPNDKHHALHEDKSEESHEHKKENHTELDEHEQVKH